MELGGLGEAFNFISPGAFSEGFVLRFFQHAINGLEYLHSKGIVHRDLKADNMVLDIRGNVRDCCVCVCVFCVGRRRSWSRFEYTMLSVVRLFTHPCFSHGFHPFVLRTTIPPPPDLNTAQTL